MSENIPQQPDNTPQPQYSAPPPPAQYASAQPVDPGFNIFAILGFILVWFTGILGIIFGAVALSQIKRTGQRGHGLALAAVIIGAIGIVFAIILVVILVVIGLATGGTTSTY